jgi:transposase-like protein
MIKNIERSRHRRSQRDYSLAFKLEVISLVESGQCTYKEAQRRFGIQGKSTVLVWLRKHGTLDWKIPITMNSPESKIKELEAKLQKLEKELKEERLKREMADTILEVAEEQFGIAIRKKFSPKQLNDLSQKKK